MIKHKRLDIVLVNLGSSKGSVYGGVRPCLIVSNNVGNLYSPTLTIAPITSKSRKFEKTHLSITLDVPSVILFESIQTICKKQIIQKIGSIDSKYSKMVDYKIKIALNIDRVCDFNE